MDMRFIEVCIGLVLVFALTSLLVTTVTEIWASVRGRRGANLERALRSMLADDPGKGGWHGLFPQRRATPFTQALLDHPLMVSQSQGREGEQGKPSYLSGDLVVSVLLDLLAKATPGGTRPDSPRLLMASLQAAPAPAGAAAPPPELLRSLDTLAQGVDSDWPAYERRLVAWFDSIGERSIGWYKRWNQMRLAAFGFLIAATFNVNPFVIAQRLWNEEPLRRATVAMAESASEAYKAAQAASSPDPETLQRVLKALPPAASAPATASTAAQPTTASAARVDAAMSRLREELDGAQGKDRDSLDRLAKLARAETELRELIRRRRASIADDSVPEQLLEFSLLVDEELQRLLDLSSQSRLTAVEQAAREARAALLTERADLLVRALPAPSGQRCRSATTPEARALCERIEGVRSLGDGGLPVGWHLENLPGCDEGRCARTSGDARTPDQVRSDLRVKIAQQDRAALQGALEACKADKPKPGSKGCEALDALLRQEGARGALDLKLTAEWRVAAAALRTTPISAGEVFLQCVKGEVPCNRVLLVLGWLVIGLASVLGAPFWFDMLGRLIQLRGSGSRPADGAQGGNAAPAPGGGNANGPGGGMLAQPAPVAPPAGGDGGLNGGSSDTLSEAERTLTADDIDRLQRNGLNMPAALITRRLDTETRKRIAQWQDAQKQTPADGVLTGPQIDRLLRGTAPPPAQPPVPTAPLARGATPVRSDGSIAPLTEQEIRDLYGDIATVENTDAGAQAGTVKVVAEGKPGGPQRVLEALTVPASLAGKFPAGLRIHQRVRPHLEAVLQEIDATPGLADQILRCNGTVVERHIGWNPVNRLSSHTWGIAIDLNADQNKQGNTPAPEGAPGSVLDLVPIFNKHGFAWGGDFRNGGPDGMHFELALRQP
ncbi:hypothetical protein CDN99_05120 [Roseateles aquatilis]|uniref:Peptidase M15C domain-containing protein n=1 Tax=Roseateles aquatilis TaxID=431061 RepID=A0A246JME8_9BURK|nr:M15 family metallopeptidase [Roseateles aquatilis]OWQ93818.1 hypothetical protein CDN99_05120 [Roseateles aquatilis]